MDGPGTLTWEEFVENAEKFVAVSDRLFDGWEFYGDTDVPGQAYLVRKVVCWLPVADSVLKDGEATGNNDDDDDDTEEYHARFEEDPYEAPSATEMSREYITEHHILWSMSYGVPVLFFNGWRADSTDPVSVNEAQTAYGSKLNYAELSQAIHPIVGTPFLQLHPCLSRELLRGMSNSKNKLVSWLSCMASAALNLKIHPEYYELTC